MKKTRIRLIALLLSGLLIGCSSSNNAASTQTAVSQSEETSLEMKAEESESAKDNSSEAVQEDDEETSAPEETSVKETEPETTAFIPDFKDKTLALECQDTIELPDTLKQVSFSSAQPEVVSVDEHGTLTALALGTADITVEINEEPYTFEVVVTTPEISDTSIRKIAGNTARIFFYGTAGTPVFKSDNPAIASVDEKGVVTAEFTGSGQSTKIHAFIDGKEFIVDVAVEPIPQLLNTYQLSVHNDSNYSLDSKYQYKNVNLALTGNTNEIMHVEHLENNRYNCSSETVLNVADVDYSSGDVYPLYRAYPDSSTGNIEAHAQIYLAGSSQDAVAIIKRPNGGECQSQITYTPCDGYGIIDIQYRDSAYSEVIASVLIDGYTYTLAVGTFVGGVFRYEPGFEKKLPANYIVKECTVEDTVVSQSSSSSGVRSNSKTFYGSSFVSELGGKIIEAVEDEAISYAVGTIFKLLF